MSRVKFTPEGLVTQHHDYWDPTGQLYEKLPLLGRLFRALRIRLAAPQGSESDTQSNSSATTLRNRT